MGADLNRLISLGGTGVKSPVQRYQQAKKDISAEQTNRLARMSTEQGININSQKMQMLQQENQFKGMASLGDYLDTVATPDDPQYKEKRLQALKAAYPKFQQQGIPTPPPDMPIEQVDAKIKQAQLRVNGKPESPYSKINPSQYTQESVKIYNKTRNVGDLKAKESKGQTINIGGDQNEFAKSLAKSFGQDFVKKRDDAVSSRDSLISANNAVDFLDSGVITGTGANYITSAGKALQRIGFNVFEDPIANTEAYYANQAKQVANIIKAFGAGTGLSDADREYAEKASAGKITMSEKSLRKIIEINQKASSNTIENFNKDVGKIPEGTVPFDLTIDLPSIKSPTQKQENYGDMSQEQIDRLNLLREQQGG